MMYRSTDGGATWGWLANTFEIWTSFDVSGDGRVAFGVRSYNQRGATLSTNSATTLVDVPGVASRFNDQLAVGGISRNGQVLIAATYGTTSAMSTDSGTTWEPAMSGPR